MFFKDELETLTGNIKLFVDMDGVIADFDVGKAKDYDKKRPLKTSIEKLKEISQMPNVELFILSVTRADTGLDEKHTWLDKFAPFFKKENRIIISREANNFEHSAVLKANYLKELEKDDSIIILIDDDLKILKQVKEDVPEVILYKDTCLVD